MSTNAGMWAWSLGGPEVSIIMVFLLLGGAVLAVVLAAVLAVVLRRGSRRPGQSDPSFSTSPLSAEADEALRRLAQLKADGVISEAEFEAKNREILKP